MPNRTGTRRHFSAHSIAFTSLLRRSIEPGLAINACRTSVRTLKDTRTGIEFRLVSSETWVRSHASCARRNGLRYPGLLCQHLLVPRCQIPRQFDVCWQESLAHRAADKGKSAIVGNGRGQVSKHDSCALFRLGFVKADLAHLRLFLDDIDNFHLGGFAIFLRDRIHGVDILDQAFGQPFGQV